MEHRCTMKRKGRYSTMLYDKVEIAAIKLALYNIDTFNDSGEEILLKSIAWLKESYEECHNIIYLQKAVWHIYVYLELGFPFERGEGEFKQILEYLGKDVEEVFPKKKYFHRKMELSKANIRNLLGRWNPRFHSMKIEDAVSDIMEKAVEKQEGEYIYHSGKVIEQTEDKVLWENTFKLYVRQDEAVFYDVNKNKYYVLIER